VSNRYNTHFVTVLNLRLRANLLYREGVTHHEKKSIKTKAFDSIYDQSLLTFLNEFKNNPSDEGYCAVFTGLVDQPKIRSHPIHWELETNNDTFSSLSKLNKKRELSNKIFFPLTGSLRGNT